MSLMNDQNQDKQQLKTFTIFYKDIETANQLISISKSNRFSLQVRMNFLEFHKKTTRNNGPTILLIYFIRSLPINLDNLASIRILLKMKLTHCSHIMNTISMMQPHTLMAKESQDWLKLCTCLEAKSMKMYGGVLKTESMIQLKLKEHLIHII